MKPDNMKHDTDNVVICLIIRQTNALGTNS